MDQEWSETRQHLATFSAVLPVLILALIILSLPLRIAQDLGLSEAQTISWIFALYGASSVLALGLAYHYKQPLLMTGNLFVIIFIGSLGGELSYPELTGASMLAGLGVLLVSGLGLSSRLARWIPAPVVLGLLVGAIVPFLTDMVVALGQAPLIVGSTLAAFILSRPLLSGKVPAILPALIVGLAASALTGQFSPPPSDLHWISPAITLPQFSVNSVLTAVPVMIVLITLQSNLPSMIYLENQGYQVQMRAVGAWSGFFTAIGSFLGPNGISLSLPATSLVGSDQAGQLPFRYRTIYLMGGLALLIGLLAGFAAEIPGIIPRPLLLALAGLAIFDVLTSSLRSIFAGPVIAGPMFALIVSLSNITLLGFGSFFWGLVLGTVVSWLWEREQIQQLPSTGSSAPESTPPKAS